MFSIISSIDFPAKTLSWSGATNEANDQSRIVESREHDASRNGRTGCMDNPVQEKKIINELRNYVTH